MQARTPTLEPPYGVGMPVDVGIVVGAAAPHPLRAQTLQTENKATMRKGVVVEWRPLYQHTQRGGEQAGAVCQPEHLCQRASSAPKIRCKRTLNHTHNV